MSSLNDVMNQTMAKMKELVDVNTVIGTPITTPDGTTLIPVSKVTFGFASGGSDFNGKNPANKDLFGGGSGAGVSVTPVAFLIIQNGNVRTVQLANPNNTVERALNMLPFDLVSMYLGSLKYPYLTYFSGSIVGAAFGVLSATLIGRSLTDPTSPMFIFSCVLSCTIAGASFVMYRRINGRKRQK